MSVANGYYTVRLVFSKTGRARFISHLDLYRAMTRVLRRADVPLWYTEGFNKHPYITFAAPLSLGVESLCERIEFRLTDETVALDELVDRINRSMPEGLKAISAAEAVRKIADLGSAAYEIDCACSPEKWAEFIAQEEILAEKKTKKKGGVKTLDLKPYVTDGEAIPTETGMRLCITLPCGNDLTINPSLLMTAFNAFCGEKIDRRILRVELYDRDKAVFC